jgi:tRNA(Ile)-lysidine synthase
VLAANSFSAQTNILSGLTGFSRVAIAVSGGSDSMALLRMVEAWRHTPHGPSAVFALTVDHGLRPESADEAQKVAAWCAAIGVEHVVLQWTSGKPVTGIQAKARSARYDLMSAWCRENSVAVLMTAHTAEDQAETVIMRQQRTMTDRSLAAIWPENEWRGVKLYRPLLTARRQDLRDYLGQLEQDWLNDPSNTNSKFERVRVRESLLASDVQGLAELAEAAQQRVLKADEDLKQWRQRFVKIDDYAVLRFPRPIFKEAERSLQIDIVSWSLNTAGDLQKPERAVSEAICDWIADGKESRRSANGAIVSARRHMIEVMREPSRISSRFQPVGQEGSLIFDGRFNVTAPQGAMIGAMGLPAQLKRPKDVPALAFSALPVVKLTTGELFPAVKSGRIDILATLCERFSL